MKTIFVILLLLLSGCVSQQQKDKQAALRAAEEGRAIAERVLKEVREITPKK